MTTPSGGSTRARRDFSRRQAVGALLAGLVGALAHCGTAVLAGIHLVAEESLWLGNDTLVVEAVLLLAIAWAGAFAVARAFGVHRAAWVVSLSLVGATLLTAGVGFVVAQAAILIGLFSLLLVWNGDAVIPLVVLSVALVLVFAVLAGPVVALLIGFGFARRTLPTAPVGVPSSIGSTPVI